MITPTPRQEEILKCKEPMVIVNTPPGSGKTYIAAELTRKAYSGRFLAVTFNKKAAIELQTRAGVAQTQNGKHGTSYCSTFHSYCYQFLKERGLIERVHHRTLDACLNELLKTYEEPDYYFSATEVDELFLDYSLINSAKKEMLYAYTMAVLLNKDPLKYFKKLLVSQRLRICLNLPKPVKIFKKFLREKRSNRWVAFVDLLAMTWKRVEQERESFDYLILDEAQDLDVLQIKIIERLLPHVKKQTYLIGDADQKIYTWRGADSTPLISWPGKRLPLDKSFRVNKAVAEFVKRLIRKNTNRVDIDWDAVDKPGTINFYAVPKDASISPLLYVKDLIQQNGKSATILCRTNYHLERLAKKLLDEGMVVDCGEGLAFGFTKGIARASLSWLEYAISPHMVHKMQPEERLEFTKQLGTGIRGVGEKRWMQAYEKTTATTFYLPEIVTVKALAKKYGKVDFDTLVQKPLEEQIEIVTRMTTGKTSNAVAQNILTVMNHRPDFIDAIKNPPAAISTVHKFKGKQDARIVLIGANEKLMPHERGELEEERRLLFVAATRSEGDVDIFFNRQSPSRFLNEMAT